MSHTQTKELNKITLGSMDFYVTEFTGSVPADNVIEVEDNMIGRTKNGATINYTTNWYTAESDDGKAKKRKLTGESATIGYGNITWNGNTLSKLIATARTSETNSKRTTKIGGISNDNGKRYLIRGVYKDGVDGDVRITGVGVNTGGGNLFIHLHRNLLSMQHSSLNQEWTMKEHFSFTRRRSSRVQWALLLTSTLLLLLWAALLL